MKYSLLSVDRYHVFLCSLPVIEDLKSLEIKCFKADDDKPLTKLADRPHTDKHTIQVCWLMRKSLYSILNCVFWSSGFIHFNVLPE